MQAVGIVLRHYYRELGDRGQDFEFAQQVGQFGVGGFQLLGVELVLHRGGSFGYLYGHQFGDAALVDETQSVDLVLLCGELEAVGDIEVLVQQDPVVVLVDDDAHVLPLTVLRTDVHIVLLPVGVQRALNFLVIH